MTIREFIASWDGCTNLDDEIAGVYWTEESIRDYCEREGIEVTPEQTKRAIAAIDGYLENEVEIDMYVILTEAGVKQ